MDIADLFDGSVFGDNENRARRLRQLQTLQTQSSVDDTIVRQMQRLSGGDSGRDLVQARPTQRDKRG